MVAPRKIRDLIAHNGNSDKVISQSQGNWK